MSPYCFLNNEECKLFFFHIYYATHLRYDACLNDKKIEIFIQTFCSATIFNVTSVVACFSMSSSYHFSLSLGQIFNVFANIQAMIDLRDNKNNLVKDDQLKMFKFPPAEVDKTTNDVLSGDFPQWKEKVNSQGYNLAVMGASISTGAFVQSQVIMKVKCLTINDHIYAPKVSQ